MSLDDITDGELRMRLAEHGIRAGPVTATTRTVLMRQLKSLMGLQVNPRFHTEARRANEDLQLVFFDIETSGLEMTCDVLQIAAKTGSHVFNQYLKPTKKIPADTTAINNLSNRNGELYYKDKIVSARPARAVLEDFLGYLRQFGKPCVLVAHNCSFDSTRLIRVMRRESMETAFVPVIAGFTDTLRMFRYKFPHRTWKGACTLSTLVKETLSIPADGAHDASADVRMLEELALHHFNDDELLMNRLSFNLAA